MRISFEIITKESNNEKEMESTIVTNEVLLTPLTTTDTSMISDSLMGLFEYRKKASKINVDLIENFVKTLLEKIEKTIKTRPEFSIEDLDDFQGLVNRYLERLDEEAITITGITMSTSTKDVIKLLEEQIIKMLCTYLLITEVEIVVGNVNDYGTFTTKYNITIPSRTKCRFIECTSDPIV